MNLFHLLPSWSRSLAGLEPLHWTPLGEGNGFSGAAVWRGDDASGTPHFALKQWPATMSDTRLAEIHIRMGQGSHLPFVPKVISTNDGGTLRVELDRVWDLTTWMPGRPNPANVASACAALAELHRAWRPAVPRLAPAPAVQRRLAILDEWHGEPKCVAPFIEPARLALRPWLRSAVPLQPCLCDVHGEHILFTGAAVTGVIDYGAVKLNHVAVDLARYLGDVCGDDENAFNSGLNAYRAAGGILDGLSNFTRVLDRTGLVCAIIGWTQRLKKISSPNRAIRNRIAQLAARLASLREI